MISYINFFIKLMGEGTKKFSFKRSLNKVNKGKNDVHQALNKKKNSDIFYNEKHKFFQVNIKLLAHI